MSDKDDIGVDYSGPGRICNRDPETGIRYGIIPINDLNEWAWDSFEADYGNPTCPQCGNVVANEFEDQDTEGYEPYREHSCDDYACNDCLLILGSEDVYGDEPLGWTLDDGLVKAFMDSSNDVWVVKSPYYTRAQFCSPCAPGAAYLSSPREQGPKAYCLGPDWFGKERPCPYPIYRVDNNELVYSPGQQEEDDER